jgi:proteasome accessory factor C
VERRHALHITYYTAARDETTERVVDPMRVLVAEGRAYLEAWCRRAGAVRLFRVDRIDGMTELEEPAAPPAHARPADLSAGVFSGHPDLPLVTLRVGRSGRWITEYYPCEEIVEESPDRWLVSLRATDLAWARRLVMGLGPEVTVVAPAQLVESVPDQARIALAAYGVDLD